MCGEWIKRIPFEGYNIVKIHIILILLTNNILHKLIFQNSVLRQEYNTNNIFVFKNNLEHGN